MSELVLDFGAGDVVDVGVVAVLVWLVLRYLRSTRARPALAGLLLLGAIYLLARWLALELTAALFQAFFAVLVLILVVVFQEDLRRAFERLGALGRRRNHEDAPPDAFYLVLTHSHDLDLRITEAILRRGDFAYLGLIGSQTKRARFVHRFEERGIAAATLARLTCPIGLPGIVGKEPEVIAVAVVAQLLQRSRAF